MLPREVLPALAKGRLREGADVLAGVLLHEIHHIVLGHLTHSKYRGLAHPEALEIAMELSANEGIREPLPAHVAIADYAALGIRPGQSTLERYALLVEAARRGSRRVRGQACRTADAGTITVDDHGPWREPLVGSRRDPTGTAAAARIARLIAAAASHVRGPNGGTVAGQEPARVIEELGDAAIDPLNWRTALRAFAAREPRRTFDYRRPNRRFPERVGEIPGRGRRDIDSLPTLVIAIDTSSSMTKRELDAIAAQLEHMRQLTSLIIVECDVAIQRTYAYEGKLRRVAGRGGTDLRPVFAPEVIAELGAVGIIYFTDGEGPFPEDPPPIPTLWVLTKEGHFRCPWGARVRMHPRAAHHVTALRAGTSRTPG